MSVVSSHHDRAGEHWTKTIRYRLIHLLIRHIGQVGRDRDDAACGNDITKAIQPDGRVRIRTRHRRKRVGYGKLFRQPTAVRRGVSGSRVPKHLHLPVTHDKQAETAGRERDDALIGERTERFWDGLTRRRIVLLSTAGELDVAVDRDDAADATQSEAVGCIRRFPWLGYGMLSAGQYEFLPCFLHVLEDAQIGLEVIPCGGLDVAVSELSCDHADVGSGFDRQRAERVA